MSRRNAALTCRHFGISRQTFYRWRRRYESQNLASLESHSHRPHRGRQPTWTAELAERVRYLRSQYPRWGKDKLVVLLGREGRRVSTSMVARILTRLKQRGVLVEPPLRRVAAPRRLHHRLWAIRKPRHWPVSSQATCCRWTRWILLETAPQQSVDNVNLPSEHQ